MIKRILLPVVILASVIFIGYVYWTLASTEKSYASSLAAIPSDVSLVAVSSSDSLYAPAFAASDSLSNALWPEWQKCLAQLKAASTVAPTLDSAWKNNGFAMCAGMPFQSNKWLLSIGLASEIGSAEIEAFLKKWSGKDAAKSEFKGSTVYTSKNNDLTLNCAAVAGCLVLSSSSSLLESSILSEVNANAIRTQPLFDKAWKTASNELPLHLFVNDEKGGWIALDPNANGAFGNMLGYWFASDSLPNRLAVLSTEGSFGSSAVLPASTVWLEAYSYSDFETGWALAGQQNEAKSSEVYWSQAWSATGDSCGCDVNEAMLSWRGNEWGTAFFDHKLGRSAVAFFKVADSLNAMPALQPLLSDSVLSVGNTIAAFKYPELWQRNFPLPAAVGGQFVTQIKNYVVVGPTAQVLSDLAVSIKAEQTLDGQASLQTAFSVVQPQGGLWMFQTANGSGWWPEALHAIFSQELFLSMHLVPAGDKRFLMATASSAQRNKQIQQPKEQEEPAIPTAAEQTDDEAEPKELPLDEQTWTVINHTTKEKEQLVQDKDNQLILKDNKGKVLWKKPLPGRITSTVYQVDALKNGKLQMVFSSAAQIYALDRNGNSLKGFPIVFESSITAPVAVVDYDNTKNYRLLVGLENGEVLNYSIDGKPTAGWNFAKTKKVVTSITHEKRGGKDVLILNKGERILKRNGTDSN